MFNYYFDTEREAHADTVKLFEEINEGKYRAYTSPYAIGELEKAPEEKYLKMLGLIEEYGITILPASDEADKLGALYQERGILPARSTVDAQHIACATINDIDMILSLNFEHIVRKKTLEMTGFINTELGYRPIKIHSPMEVVDRENS
jgi:predicted nucleic acid-binding protein